MNPAPPRFDPPRALLTTALVALSAQVAMAGLAAHWRFHGNLLDSGASASHATFAEGIEPRFVVGHDGAASGALLLSGLGEFAEVSNSTVVPVSRNENYTIAFWVRGSPQTARTIYSEGGGEIGGAHLIIGTRLSGGTGEIRVELDLGGGDIVLSGHSERVALDGEWHHVAWVERSGSGVLYIDGLRDATEFRRAARQLDFTRVGFGGTVSGEPCCFFSGGLDDLRAFDHALTEFEIQELVENPPGCPAAGDTRCGHLELAPVPDTTDVFIARAVDSTDESGDSIRYLFLAESDEGDSIEIGPQSESSTEIILSSGTWNVSVIVDDDPSCFDRLTEATCSEGPVVIGCPASGDTHCGGLVVTRPREGGVGAFRFEIVDAVDDSGDAILYSLRAEGDDGRALELGPSSSPRFEVDLRDGEWTITATVDDDLECDDIADDAVCTQVVTVGCPLDGDTICGDFLIEGPREQTPGRYDVRVEGSFDESGDTIFYTFRAAKDGGGERGEELVRGPQPENRATFLLEEGSWEITVTVDDDVGCADVHPDATCTEEIDVVSEAPDEISRWNLDGTLFDARPRQNHLIPFETPEIEFTEGFNGTADGALLFALEDVCFEAQHQQSLPLRLHRAHTIALWVRGSPQREGTIWAEGSSESDTPVFAITTDPDGKTGRVSVLLRDARGRTLIDRAPSFLEPFDGTWHHLACVVDGGDLTLYVDGVRDPTSFTHLRPTIELDRTSLGCRLGTQPLNFFRGAIDDLRVFNFALSSEEILELLPEPEDCPDSGDTHVESLSVTGPEDGSEGTYTLEALGAVDDSGDPILFTFAARSESGALLQSGPSLASSADFELEQGSWTLSVEVDDDPRCRDMANDARIEIERHVTAAARELVAHLTFEANLDDVTGRGHDGLLVGADAARFVAGRDGSPLSAVELDGRDDRIDLTGSDEIPIHASGEFSVAMWVRGSAQSAKVLWSEAASRSGAIFSIGPNSRSTGAAAEINLRTAEGIQLIPHRLSTRDVFDGTWHHVAWIEADGEAKLYVDGVPDDTDFSYDRITIDFDTASIGGVAGRDACCPFEGAIDEVRIYDHAISEAEIAEIAGLVDATGFVRGDANDDGNVDLADGIFVLSFLFTGGRAPSCAEAANTNNDTAIDLTDGVYVLNYLFTGGPAPTTPSPLEGCGVEPAGAESLGCDEFMSCP